MPGTIAEGTISRRKMRVGEIAPLTAEQSARLASLYEQYGPRLVRYACSLLNRRGLIGGGAWALAEDITQSMWVQVARDGARNPLFDEAALTQDSPAGLLFYLVKQHVIQHFGGKAAGDIPVDFNDPITCKRLCGLLPSGCALIELPGYLAKMVDALPEQEREALLLMLDGLDPRSMAEHLGCGDTTAVRLADAAVLMLQIDNPELSREPVALESLPKWERETLATLSPERRAALLRLEPVTRHALLLRHQGVSKREIGQRLELSYDVVASMVRCAPAARCTPKAKSTGRRANSKFTQVAEALRQDIKGMRAGDRLPRRVELMERFGVGSRTIDNAWAVLRGEGLIEANGVYGYTVARAQNDMEQAA
ncbi:GntR family transcriptional regulator [Streptomyces sp. NPDC127066]|uniref:GntR family transcriptional regulator n=1 Tax=Streptomyces sp. NPDC127066 TaxID=3347125 RepID=UPI003659AEA6